MNDYSDIINYDYQGPKNHPRMPRENRAMQFASFKALNGYDESLKETRRKVDSKIILSDDQKELLDKNLNYIMNNLAKKIKITYFIKDLYKDGGFYKTIETNIIKIDLSNNLIVIKNKEKILLDNILNIDIY